MSPNDSANYIFGKTTLTKNREDICLQTILFLLTAGYVTDIIAMETGLLRKHNIETMSRMRFFLFPVAKN